MGSSHFSFALVASHDIDPLGRSSEPGIQEEEDSFAFEDVFAFQGTQEPLFCQPVLAFYKQSRLLNRARYLLNTETRVGKISET